MAINYKCYVTVIDEFCLLICIRRKTDRTSKILNTSRGFLLGNQRSPITYTSTHNSDSVNCYSNHARIQASHISKNFFRYGVPFYHAPGFVCDFDSWYSCVLIFHLVILIHNLDNYNFQERRIEMVHSQSLRPTGQCLSFSFWLKIVPFRHLL